MIDQPEPFPFGQRIEPPKPAAEPIRETWRPIESQPGYLRNEQGTVKASDPGKPGAAAAIDEPFRGYSDWYFGDLDEDNQ